MEGAIFLIVLIVIAVIVTPIVIAASSNSKINKLYEELRAIKEYLRTIKKDIDGIAQTPPAVQHTPWQSPMAPEAKPSAPPETPVVPQAPVPETAIFPEAVAVPEVPLIPEAAEETVAIPETPLAEVSSEAIPETGEAEIPVTANEDILQEEELLTEEAAVYFDRADSPRQEAALPPTPPAYTPPPPRKKTDFEQFIGEKLISIVGIAILVLGIFFSVKWAIDRHLISDAGKVMIGLVAGTILIAVAHRLARNYRAFSSILAGGGIAVFYFSIYEAYQSYHLLPQTAAFMVMVAVTILAVILSIIYDKKELAVIAIVGGFCTPFFVSDGSGNYQVLFTYLLILNLGMFALAYFKKWNLVNIICYCFTMLLFSGWVFKAFDVSKGHAAGGMLFISLFFLIFFGMNIVYNLRHRAKFGFTEISMLLSNSFIYLGFGLYFLSYIHNGDYQGIFTLALSAFNFIFAFAFYKRQQVDRNLVYLLIGLVLTFLSLTGPLQLDGNYITLFWASELVILYWMGTRTGIELLKNASILVLGLTLISLGMDLQNDYYGLHVSRLPIVLNKAFITCAVVILAIIIKSRLIRKDTAETLLWGELPKKYYLQLTGALTVVVIYLSGLFEVQYQGYATTRSEHFRDMLMWMYQYLILAVMAWYFSRKAISMYLNIVMVLMAFMLLLYPVANLSVIQLRKSDLVGSLYYLHYLQPLLALICTGQLIGFVRENYAPDHNRFKTAAWGITALLLFIVSAEAIHIWVDTTYQPGFDMDDLVLKARKVALPILWSLSSLGLMLLGMRRKLKIFRIISLSIFSLTIAKLFLYDISNVGQGGKIAAFIILGVILLVVSFMYQKIKGLFTNENEDHNAG